MQIILHAAPCINRYGLIFNQVSTKEFSFFQKPENSKLLLENFEDLRVKPSHYCFMENDPDLSDRDNVVKPLPSNVIRMFRELEKDMVKMQEANRQRAKASSAAARLEAEQEANRQRANARIAVAARLEAEQEANRQRANASTAAAARLEAEQEA